MVEYNSWNQLFLQNNEESKIIYYTSQNQARLPNILPVKQLISQFLLERQQQPAKRSSSPSTRLLAFFLLPTTPFTFHYVILGREKEEELLEEGGGGSLFEKLVAQILGQKMDDKMLAFHKWSDYSSSCSIRTLVGSNSIHLLNCVVCTTIWNKIETLSCACVMKRSPKIT